MSSQATAPEDMTKTGEAEQMILGRNILQVADGDERSAKRFLQSLADRPTLWPEAFIKGVTLECFVNETEQLRLKCDHLKEVLRALAGLDEAVRLGIVKQVTAAISGAAPKDVYLSKAEFEKACAELGSNGWAAPLKEAAGGPKGQTRHHTATC